MTMSVVGGLGLFMLGMKYMSEGMQAVAGNSLRRMISLVTNNRFLAVGAGTAVTVLVQSSTISTVITVGLVNAGLMQLHQAIGVMIGANVGTTITGWILVLKIGKYGLPILGAAALVYVFSRRDRPRFIAMAVMGLGMVFFGLELMKDGFAPMKDIPMFVEAFAWFSADSYGGILLCVLIGCVLTMLVQSSSATLGITIGLAATGVIPFTTAAALVLGENIGTTITVWIASLGANVNAKRASYAHVLFNVIGATWIVLLFPLYIVVIGGIVESLYGTNPIGLTLAAMDNPVLFAAIITTGIAATHTGFNVANTILFIPFVRPFARMLERLVPDPAVKEVAHLKRLDPGAVSAPVLGVEQSRAEVIRMGDGVLKMGDWIYRVGFVNADDEEAIRKSFRREEVLDTIQQEIVTFLTDLLDASVPHAITDEGRRQIRIAHEYESMGDRLTSILKAYLKLRDRQIELPDDMREELRGLHEAVMLLVRDVAEAYAARTPLAEADAQAAGKIVTRHFKRLRDEHLQRMTSSAVDPALSLIYTGLLTDYRRVRAHAMNVHDAFVEADLVAS